MPEELFSTCPCHTGGIFLCLSEDRNWIAFWLLNCSKFIPQNFVILTFLNVNKEVEMSAAWFMIEITQEGGNFFCLHGVECKH